MAGVRLPEPCELRLNPEAYKQDWKYDTNSNYLVFPTRLKTGKKLKINVVKAPFGWKWFLAHMIWATGHEVYIETLMETAISVYRRDIRVFVDGEEKEFGNEIKRATLKFMDTLFDERRLSEFLRTLAVSA